MIGYDWNSNHLRFNLVFSENKEHIQIWFYCYQWFMLALHERLNYSVVVHGEDFGVNVYVIEYDECLEIECSDH